MAVDAGEGWLLLNASPEIRGQIESFECLHPSAPRGTPLLGVVLTNADLDHCLGLLSLREWTPLQVFTSEAIRCSFAEDNILCRVLDRISWRPIALGRAERVGNLRVEAFPAPGKVPRYREGERDARDEDNLGLRITDARGRVLVYAPSAARVTPVLLEACEGADCIFFDGTFATADELPRHASTIRDAAVMGHLPVLGPGGSLGALAKSRAARRIYIHVNNTNPMLIETSPARAAVEAAGWEVAWDGMDFEV